MKPSIPSFKFRAFRGFSLVEVQVAVAVLGLISAIAVPNIARIGSSANEVKIRRNAQYLASVVDAAHAAGVEFTSLDNALGAITSAEGASPSRGALAGDHYRVTSLSNAELNDAKRFLSFVDGQISYASE